VCIPSLTLASPLQGNPARLVWTTNGPHDNVIATVKKVPFPLRRREFVARQLSVDDGVLSWFTYSVDANVDYGSKKCARAVRARTTAAARFKPVEGRDDQCELHFVLLVGKPHVYERNGSERVTRAASRAEHTRLLSRSPSTPLVHASHPAPFLCSHCVCGVWQIC